MGVTCTHGGQVSRMHTWGSHTWGSHTWGSHTWGSHTWGSHMGVITHGGQVSRFASVVWVTHGGHGSHMGVKSPVLPLLSAGSLTFQPTACAQPTALNSWRLRPCAHRSGRVLRRSARAGGLPARAGRRARCPAAPAASPPRSVRVRRQHARCFAPASCRR
jgi:hypothetical protein